MRVKTAGLRDASSRDERFGGIEDFADRTDTRIAKMRFKPFQKSARALKIVGINAQPRIDECA